MFEHINQISRKDVESIIWTGDPEEYDVGLYELGDSYDTFLVVNPYLSDSNLIHYIDNIPTTDKCIVWKYRDEWVAKLFSQGWNTDTGYEEITLTKPKIVWRKNQDLDRLMTFEDDPFGTFESDPWDCRYKLVWYIDPRFNPLPDKVWAISCQPIGVTVEGVKDMGYLTPCVDVEINSDIADLGVDIDQCYPPFYELEYESAWELDPIHTPEKRMWIIKITPAYRAPKEWKWQGIISPNLQVEYNPDLPTMVYDIDYVIPHHDFEYEHVWMLDNKHLQHGEDEIWAFKIKASDALIGSKIVGYISPNLQVEYNPDLPTMDYDIDFVIPHHDFEYEHVWYIDLPTAEKIWSVKMKSIRSPCGEKDMGYFIPQFNNVFDVIFISYHELNAEENWQRVLEKAPYAKRVDGVKGIFKAHKAAAKLAKTDMFYVVDGDAWLVDEWEFNFQPNIFDRDCAYVWSSINPVNDLTYQNGGVKLLSKQTLMKQKKCTTIDIFTGIMPKIKAEDTISCITRFNVDEFSTWRSAFRECVKLYTNNQMSKLNAWLKSDVNKPYGEYAALGAKLAYQYAKENKDNQTALLAINNYSWLEQQFKKLGNNINGT